MSLCPRCEYDLGENPAGPNCPRCGVRLNARRRSLSGFSLPVAATGSSPPSAPPRPSTPPVRREADEDSWGASGLTERDSAPAPAPSPVTSGASLFRASQPSAAVLRDAPTAAAETFEAGPTTRVLGEEIVAEARARRAESEVPLPPVAPPMGPSSAATGAIGAGLPRREGAPASTRATLVQSAPGAVASNIRQTLVMSPGEVPLRAPTRREEPRAIEAPTRVEGASPEPARSMRSTLVMNTPPRAQPEPPAPAARPSPARSERGASTLIMSPAAHGGDADPPGSSTLLMAAAPPELRPEIRSNKSTLVSAAPPPGLAVPRPAPPAPPRDEGGVGSSTLMMAQASPAPRPPPAPAPAPAARPALALRPPIREDAVAPAVEVVPSKDEASPFGEAASPPGEAESSSHDVALRDAPADDASSAEWIGVRDTVDPLGSTMPVSDLVERAGIDLDDPITLEAPLRAPAPAEPAPAAPPVMEDPLPSPASPVPPSRLSAPPGETARLSALVSTRAMGTRLPRSPGLAERRLRRVSLVAAPVLLVSPWLAPFRRDERAVALAAGLAAAVTAWPRLGEGPRAAVAVSAGAVALALWLGLTTDLTGLALALTTALMVLLPGALFHRRDRPDASRGAAVVALGLLVGAAWMLLPGAGGALRASMPPVLPQEYATVALAPWLLLGAMAVPRATAAASGSPFAGGVLLWAGALAMLRSSALDGEMVARWRVVACAGLCSAALSALLAAGVARALDDEA